MDFDPVTFAIAGVGLIPLTFGLVEFIKSVTGVSGKPVTLISAFTGAALFGLYRALEFIPEPYNTIALIFVGSLAFGLSASGFYKYAEARRTLK